MRLAEFFAVPLGHPALAGHFPGHPLVPGSMILDLVIAAWGRPCQGIPSARFYSPLPPDREVEVRFVPGREPGTVGFDCRCGTQRVCSGHLLPANTA